MNHIITTPKVSFEKLVNTNFLGTFLFTRENFQKNNDETRR